MELTGPKNYKKNYLSFIFITKKKTFPLHKIDLFFQLITVLIAWMKSSRLSVDQWVWMVVQVWTHLRSTCGLPADNHPRRPESHQ